MSNSPAVSGKRLIKALKRIGYLVKSQKGSHVFMYHPDNPRSCGAVPSNTNLKKGTLMGIKKQFGFSDEEFDTLLRQC
jgi:predicted RNA binding protein YcfA (HicA-like mRNA interferase family)